MPKYADVDQNIDDEEMTYNFKTKKGEVVPPREPTVELKSQHGLLPDEFHNTEFEHHRPDLVQPVHYDHYDPHVEGFFGAGYNFEPMERQHHQAEERRHEVMHERSLFTPGHFTPGEYEDFQNVHSYDPYHRDISGPGGLMDERSRMDLYMPAYAAPAQIYAPSYSKVSLP